MLRKKSLQPLKGIQTTKDKENFDEQPMSPTTRLLHEPGANVYIIAIIGMKTRVNPDVLKANGVHVINKNHRFSSLQVLNKETGSMTWVPTHVNIDDHVIVPELHPNMKSSDKFVEDYISNLSRSHIENSKPLWDLHILNVDTQDAQGTCIFRFHHSLGDGMSLMNLLLSCSRKASDLEARPTFPGEKGSSRHSRVTTFRSIIMIIWNSIIALMMFILTLMFLKDTETPLKGSRGIEDRPRRFVLTGVSLDDIKVMKKHMDVTVNDIVLGVIQAGLYRYLERRYGEDNNSVPENIRLRAISAFNIRASTMINAFTTSTGHGELGYKVGYVLLPLNMKQPEDPLDYVREVKNAMDRKKASLEPFWTSFFANLVIKLFGFKIAGKLNHKVYSSVTLCFSNVAGPQEEISFFGHEVAYIAPTCYGLSMALLIHVISYVDKVTFVVSVDEETIPDPQNLCDDLQQSYHLIKNSALADVCVKN